MFREANVGTRLRKLTIALCSMIGITLSSAAFADQWVSNVTPTQIRSSGMYTVVTFSTVQTVTNPMGCNQAFYVVTATHQSQFALAILMAAYVAGTNVSIYVLTGSCDSTGGIPVTDVMTAP